MLDTFDEATHTYRRDGIIVPSCTRVLDFYGITPDSPAAQREHARVRGAVVDLMIQEIERGGDPADIEIPWGQKEADIGARICAYKQFRREVPISRLVIQRWRIATIDLYAYGVTPDIICEMGGVPAAIDIKCTYNAEKTHAIQTAAQVIAECGKYGIPHDWIKWGRFCLYLKKDGSYKLKSHNDFRDFYRWRKLLAAYEVSRELRGETIWQEGSPAPSAGQNTKTIVG